jgi:hypothetical protein
MKRRTVPPRLGKPYFEHYSDINVLGTNLMWNQMS